MTRYTTTNYIRAWYFFFTLLCIAVSWLLPPMPEVIPWRAGILILAVFGLYSFIKTLMLSVRVEDDHVVLDKGLGNQLVLGWGQVVRVERRDAGNQHAFRLYSTDGMVFETSSRWIGNLEELSYTIVSHARLTHRGTTGDRLVHGIWDVWSI